MLIESFRVLDAVVFSRIAVSWFRTAVSWFACNRFQSVAAVPLPAERVAPIDPARASVPVRRSTTGPHQRISPAPGWSRAVQSSGSV